MFKEKNDSYLTVTFIKLKTVFLIKWWKKEGL